MNEARYQLRQSPAEDHVSRPEWDLGNRAAGPGSQRPFCKVATGADMVFHAPNGPERFGKHMRTWLSW